MLKTQDSLTATSFVKCPCEVYLFVISNAGDGKKGDKTMTAHNMVGLSMVFSLVLVYAIASVI